MHILIAPNAFKNSLDAARVCKAIRKGLRQSRLSCTINCMPVADGGDGTAMLLVKFLKGKITNATVTDPLGRKITAALGWIGQSRTAIIELAGASGLKLLMPDEYDPLHTTTRGTGELIKKALDKRAKKIIICIGGSATVDGGTGLLKVLGAKFYDGRNNELQVLPASLTRLKKIDITGMDMRLADTEIIVLCDVTNTLLGAKGAAAVFGPQKGASDKAVHLLERSLAQLRDIVLAQTGKDMALMKHGGAAGGVAAALQVFTNARLVNGIDYFLGTTGFDAAIEKADLVITAEGSIDTQTLGGKAPFGVARRARSRSVPVIAFAGKVPLTPDKQLKRYFDILLPISHEAMDTQTAMLHTFDNLVRSGELLGDLLALKLKRQ